MPRGVNADVSHRHECGMTIHPLPLSLFVNNLERARAFSVVRFGDGEWLCLTRAAGQNCDGVIYTDELADALARTLTTPALGLLYCMGPKASSNQTLAPLVETWLATHAPRIVWQTSETLLDASLRGELYPFVRELARRKVMLVGGEHLRNLPVIKPVVHIQTPPRDAFAQLDRLKADVLKRAERADVILFAAGPTAKILIHALHPQLGETHSLIDIGSLFDLYAGLNSRRYARAMNESRKQYLLDRNFYGK